MLDSTLLNCLPSTSALPQESTISISTIKDKLWTAASTASPVHRPASSFYHAVSTVSSVRCLQFILLFCTLISTTFGRSAVSAKCYFFGPGTTIHGADYRREFGTTRKTCAESCKNDICCMGFEFLGGRCTLKSRSLNGTIAPLADAYFGLCLDFDDGERERFSDHTLHGTTLKSKTSSREGCLEMCGYEEEAIIYSWKADDELEPEGKGMCECITVLHAVKLEFGSSSGFLI